MHLETPGEHKLRKLFGVKSDKISKMAKKLKLKNKLELGFTKEQKVLKDEMRDFIRASQDKKRYISLLAAIILTYCLSW